MKKKQFWFPLRWKKNSIRLLLCCLLLLVQLLSFGQTPVSIPTGRPATEIFDQTGGFAITYGMLDRRLDQVTFLGLHNADITSADNPDFPFFDCSARLFGNSVASLNHEISYWNMIHKTGARFFDVDASILWPLGAVAKHGCGGGHKDMGEVFRLMKAAMDNARNTVYIITLTDMGGVICNDIFNNEAGKNITRAAVIEDMKIQGLWDRVYNKDAFASSYNNATLISDVSGSYGTIQKSWLAFNGFPTLRQMISSGRNIFLIDGKDPAYNIGGPTGAAFESASPATNTYMNMFELGKTKLSTAAANRLLASNYGMQANSLIVEDDCTGSDKEEDWFVNSGERAYQHLVEAQKHFDSQLEIAKAAYPRTELDRQIMILPIDMADFLYDFNTVEGVNKFNMERAGYDYYNLSFISQKMHPLGKGKRYQVTAFNGTNIPSNATADSKFGNATNQESRAYDGDLYSTTFYNNNSTAVFDLGTQQATAGIHINEVDIAWFLFNTDILNKGGDFRTFTLEESSDQTTWTTVGKTYDTSRDGGIYKGQRTWWRYNLSSPITKRYIRLSNFGGTSICELSFLDNRQNGPVLSCNAPTNLNSSVAGSLVTLSWASPGGGVQSYRVEYKLRTANTWTVAGATITGTSTTVSGLLNNQEYTWRVRANCNAETSVKDESSYVTAEFTTGFYCQYPAGLAVAAISTNSATVSWSPAANAQSYTVIYKRANVLGEQFTTVSAGTSTSTTLTGLAFGTEYEWLVRTNCVDGNSSLYSPAFFTTTTPPPACLGAPAPGSLFANSITSSGARVSWGLVPNVTSYTVLYRPLGSAAEFDGKVTSELFTDLTGLSSGTTYEWLVSGSCTSAGTPSSRGSFTTLGVCPAPLINTISTTSTTADISWFELDGASIYALEYRRLGISSWTTFSNALTSNAVTLTGLPSGATHFVRIRAQCGNATWSVYSSEREFTTNQPCDAPTGLAAFNIANTSVSLGWASGAIIFNHTVEYKEATSATWINGGGGAATVSLTGLRPATAYNWRVRRDCSGGSSPFVQSQFTTGAASAPCNAPSGLSSSSISSSGATVNWGAVSGATNYTVEYKTSAATTWTTASASTTATSINLTSLSSSTVYDWRVRTNCISSSSTFTQTQFTTGAAPAPCNAPSGLSSSTVSSSGATVSWAAVSGASNYTVEYKTSAATTWTTASLNTAATSVNITSLTASTVYDWRVRTNCAGSSSTFTQAQFTTGSTTAPCPWTPNHVASNITANSALLSWSPLSGATGYDVEIRESGSVDWVRVGGGAVTGTSITASNLRGGTIYTWRLQGSCSNGGKTLFATNSLTTVCPTPVSLSVTSITNVSATLNWDSPEFQQSQPVTAVSSFAIEYKLASSSTWISLSGELAGRTFSLTNLIPGSVYDWRVKANCSQASAPAGGYATSQFTTTNSSGSSCSTAFEPNATIATAVALSPNTAISAAIGTGGDNDYYAVTTTGASDLNITLSSVPSGIDYDLELFNAAGGAALARSTNNAGLNEVITVLNQPAGVYYIRVLGYRVTDFSASACYSLFAGVTPVGGVACNTATGLSSSSLSSSEATVSWSAAGGALNYTVEYKTTSASSWTTAVAGTTATTATITGLAASTVYDWRVRSNCAGNSATAQAQFTTTGATPPCAAPTGLASVPVSGGFGAGVSWTGVSGATYTLEYKASAGSTWTTVLTNANTTSTTIGSLTPSTVYDWRVRAQCSNGGISSYTQAQFTTQPSASGCAGAYEANEQASTAAAITVNTPITAAIGTSGDNDFYVINLTSTSNISISLTGVPAGIDYDLKLSNTTGNQIGSSTAGAGVNETITQSNIASGTYYIRVHGYGSSDFNASQCYTLTTGVTAVGGVSCAAPTGLSSSSISNTGASLSWTAVSGATNYGVEYKLTSSANWTSATQNTTATSFVLTGLTASSAYNWRVRANCSGSLSITEAQFTTTAASVGCVNLYEPNESQAAAAVIPLNTAITAGVAASGDNDYYQVTLTSLGNLNITLTNVPAGIDYELYLYNAAGVQIGSSTSNAGVNESISLSNQPANIYHVRVLGYNSSDFHTTQCYTLQVSTGAAGTQARIAQTANAVLENKETSAQLSPGLILYPNPISDQLTITSPTPLEKVRLVSLTGQVVREHSGFGKTTLQIPTSGLEQSVYLVQVTDMNGNVTNHRMVKQ